MQTETENAGTVEENGDGNDTLGTQSEIEVLGACKRRIKATVPVEKVREELDKNYKELSSNMQLPGFRRGRIPRKLLEARYGEEIEADVKEALVSGSLAEVIEEKSLDVVGAPKISEVQFEKDAALTYVVDLEVRPEFEVAEYKGLEVNREDISVKDDDIEERLKSLQRKKAKLVPVGLTEAGPDGVYAGKYDLYRGDVKVKGGVEVSFVPSTKVLQDFLIEDLPQQVASWSLGSGDPLKLNVKIGADYPDEVLRGADARLEFNVEETSRVELPELDDELAKAYGKESLEAVRSDLRHSLEDWSRGEAWKKVEARILEKVSAGTTLDLPEGLIETISNRRKLEREYDLLKKGMSKEEVQEMLVKEGPGSIDEIRREIKEFFILEKIAEKEKIFATEEEVDARVSQMAALYGVSPGQLRQELRTSGRFEEMRLVLRHEKVRALLRTEARVIGADGKPIEEPPGEAPGSASQDPPLPEQG